jgi:serine/threonine-protein kinase SRPK3
LKKIFKKNFDEDWMQFLKKYYKNNSYILSQINFEEHTNIIQMLNSFIYKEENNEDIYLCNVYEIMCISLQNFFDKYHKNNIINKNKGIPLPLVKIIAKEILIGLDFIHRFGEIIHNNLNMDNILIGLTKDELETIQETGYICRRREKWQ